MKKNTAIIMRGLLLWLLMWSVLIQLSCSGSGGNGDSGTAGINSATFREISDFAFAQTAILGVDRIDELDRVSYIIFTKPGNVSEDVHITYTFDYMMRTGALDLANQTLTLNIFGLYAEYENLVSVDLHYTDGVVASSDFNIVTGPNMSSNPLPEITRHHIDLEPPISFIFIRSGPESPIIMDVDGETRWHAPDLGAPARAAYFDGQDIYVGLLLQNGMYRVSWEGETAFFPIGDPRFTRSHHNIEKGKFGLLNTIGFNDGVNIRPESVLIEQSKTGEIIKVWDFDQILSDAIQAGGEDPAALVRNDFDWFHMNSAIYDPTDDSIVASSRENFVIKVDYETGNIKWILGNTDKLWFTNYPVSLQPMALQLTGNAPIGQHALSTTSDGRHLMLFNNGFGNLRLTDIGDSRTFSLVSIYEIDDVLGTANEIWSFDFPQSIYSDVCSSAYRTSNGDILITYSASEMRLVARFVVVNDAMEILYDASMPKRPQNTIACQTAYNAEEIKLNGLVFE